MSFTLRSPAFDENGPIPRRFTEDGDDISPALQWWGVPQGTVELALLVEDPDAPRPEPFVHWLVHGISPSTASLPEGAGSESAGELLQGKNDFGKEAWGGPAPPEGHGVHRYHFRLCALGKKLDPPAARASRRSSTPCATRSSPWRS